METRRIFLSKAPERGVGSLLLIQALTEIVIDTARSILSDGIANAERNVPTTSEKSFLPILPGEGKWEKSQKIWSSDDNSIFRYCDMDYDDGIDEISKLERLFDKVGVWMFVCNDAGLQRWYEISIRENEKTGFATDVNVVMSLMNCFKQTNARFTFVCNGYNGFGRSKNRLLSNSPEGNHYLNYFFYRLTAQKTGIKMDPSVLVSYNAVYKYWLDDEQMNDLYFHIWDTVDRGGFSEIDQKSFSLWWKRFEEKLNDLINFEIFSSLDDTDTYVINLKKKGLGMEIIPIFRPPEDKRDFLNMVKKLLK